MSKPQQQPTKKWVSSRTAAKEENAPRKANPGGAPTAPVTHEQPPMQLPSAQLPASLYFERQEAVDALSNLYHNTEATKNIETGPAVFHPKNPSKFHDELAEALKLAGHL